LKVFTEKIAKADWPKVLTDAEKKYKGNFDKYVDDLFAKSVFASFDKLKAFTENPSAKQLAKDPAIQLTTSRQEKVNALAAAIQGYNLQLSRGRRHFLAGLMEMQPDKVFYPDANGSTRLTYGNILSYNPKDAVHYNYYTTLEGVIEKEDPDNWEFVVPEKLKQLYLAKDYGRYALPNGELPVCFLSNNDITGGNSGSPVLNGRGELIGAAFDGNWEALSGDIAFEHGLQRTISVDIRYVLFIIEKYAGATHLIDEMTVVQ
ncbi:MAG: S46 family peptidase, partial [Prevotellaceae bacterium]|nr:S46 family peptidase [Prevotellaceae bacterium]